MCAATADADDGDDADTDDDTDADTDAADIDAFDAFDAIIQVVVILTNCPAARLATNPLQETVGIQPCARPSTSRPCKASPHQHDVTSQQPINTTVNL